jgi:hypothetical protein
VQILSIVVWFYCAGDIVAYIQERKTDDGKLHYRVDIRLKGFLTQSATFERKARR